MKHKDSLYDTVILLVLILMGVSLYTTSVKRMEERKDAVMERVEFNIKHHYEDGLCREIKEIVGEAVRDKTITKTEGKFIIERCYREAG